MKAFAWLGVVCAAVAAVSFAGLWYLEAPASWAAIVWPILMGATWLQQALEG